MHGSPNFIENCQRMIRIVVTQHFMITVPSLFLAAFGTEPTITVWTLTMKALPCWATFMIWQDNVGIVGQPDNIFIGSFQWLKTMMTTLVAVDTIPGKLATYDGFFAKQSFTFAEITKCKKSSAFVFIYLLHQHIVIAVQVVCHFMHVKKKNFHFLFLFWFD